MRKHEPKLSIEGSPWLRLPLFCVGMLGLLTIAMLCPSSAEDVNAAENTTNQYLPSTVNLTMASGVSANVEPTVDGVFKKMSTTVGIQVSSADAFSVLLHGDAEMSGAAGNNTKIKPVAANSTEASFGKNTWGYSWVEGSNASGIYNPVPANDVALVNNQATVNSQADKTYTLGFGAKVDNTIQADTYTGTVTVSVVATPKTIILHNYSVTYDANGGSGSVAAQTAQKQEASWSFTAASGASLSRDKYEFLGWSENPVATEVQYKAGDTIALTETSPQKTLYAVWGAVGGFGELGLKTMQGMTPEMCRNAEYGETAQLEDIRDGKKYWVTKLADGNCWMTQNLDFDIPAEGLSIATGSKLDWNPGNPINKTNVNNASYGRNTNSWDQGMYVYNDPTASTSCGINLYNINQCIGGSAGRTFVDVSDMMPSDDPDFTSKNGGKPVNTSTKVYDAHYLIGNYYFFDAATAETGMTVAKVGENASSDICPAGQNGKNWELPTAGEANQASGTSFYEMLNAQGVTVKAGDDAYTSINNRVDAKNPTGTGTTNMSISQALTTAPLFFVRNGEITSSNGAYVLYNPGELAWYWSRSSYNANSTFFLSLPTTNISPSRTWSRATGMPLRCLYHPD